MAREGHVDYHVHYYVDRCASQEMTLKTISETARSLGLDEIMVVKHYSSSMPNGEQDWLYWHKIQPKQFEDFLEDVRSFDSGSELRIYAGVESELVSDDGEINIDEAAQKKIDGIALSVHFMPFLDKVEKPYQYYPAQGGEEAQNDPEVIRRNGQWKEIVNDLKPEYFVERLVRGYVRAMEKNRKITQMSHMYDGLYPLRVYGIPVDDIPSGKLIEMMEPLMHAAVKHQVLWELLDEPAVRPEILQRAKEIGVRFVATADAHSIHGTWGRFPDRVLSEKYIDELRLPKGCVDWSLKK